MHQNPIINKRFAWAEINLFHLIHNLKIIKSYAASKNVRIMAVVKADAYSHGAVEISKEAVKNGARALGVALVEEGIELRKSGITEPIYILGECPPEAVAEAIKNDLILGVNSYKSAKFFSEECTRIKRDVKVNINIDTGMNRIGINFNDAAREILKVAGLPDLRLEGISTHFACASGKNDSYTKLQWDRFNESIRKVKDYKIPVRYYHCANSAAFFRHKNMHMDMARIGVSLYGLNPYDMDYTGWLDPEAGKTISDLRPVLCLKTKISFIKSVPKGYPVSYCGTFKTGRDSLIATVPVGYADGYSRMLSNKGKVLINGMYAPVVGNVTMDQFMIDITDITAGSNIKVGDEVILIGESGKNRITAQDLAELMGTINYEVVCMLKNRIPRIYIK
ncbi:MAG: alanine racemase [Actinobacteria bacterium RBG_19FT_COMBO_36_27]|nr:MAG: alanine racemase [Actinobacteria bacterium RBG_19FT_COMBO_36_27]